MNKKMRKAAEKAVEKAAGVLKSYGVGGLVAIPIDSSGEKIKFVMALTGIDVELAGYVIGEIIRTAYEEAADNVSAKTFLRGLAQAVKMEEGKINGRVD